MNVISFLYASLVFINLIIGVFLFIAVKQEQVKNAKIALFFLGILMFLNAVILFSGGYGR